MIVLAYESIACVLGFLFCLHVAPKNVKLDVRRKVAKKQQFNGSICNKSTYNGASNKNKQKLLIALHYFIIISLQIIWEIFFVNSN